MLNNENLKNLDFSEILNLPILLSPTNKKATYNNILLFCFKKYKQDNNLIFLNCIRKISSLIRLKKATVKNINTNLINKTLVNQLNITSQEQAEQFKNDFNTFCDNLKEDDPDQLTLNNFIAALQ